MPGESLIFATNCKRKPFNKTCWPLVTSLLSLLLRNLNPLSLLRSIGQATLKLLRSSFGKSIDYEMLITSQCQQ